ncbi:MAG: hypothetical protein DSY80_00585 [Desulfocapsa sp.]|nr:MAG: hypothetical protein DSY80_00585 [Desulfocapsa sp.]
MTKAEEYARRLQIKYGIEPIPMQLDDKMYPTIDSVARKVLPFEKYCLWKKTKLTKYVELQLKLPNFDK